MKSSILILTLLFLSVRLTAEINSAGFTVVPEDIQHYTVIDASENCIVVKIVTKDHQIIWNVVAAIATHFLPETVQAICTNAGGNPDHCEVVYEASSALVNLRGKGIFKGITKGVRWVAKRLGYNLKSSAAIEAKSYETAGNFKKIFEAYNNAGCMKWENPQITDAAEDFSGSFQESGSAGNTSEVYTIGWTANYVRYTGLLKLQPGGAGKLRVAYDDPSCNCTRLIEQQMQLQFVPQGIAIRGRNPVDVSTGRGAYNYYPDSFYITMDNYGNIYVTVVDAAYVSASATMQPVKNYSEKSQWLKKFGM